MGVCPRRRRLAAILHVASESHLLCLSHHVLLHGSHVPPALLSTDLLPGRQGRYAANERRSHLTVYHQPGHSRHVRRGAQYVFALFSNSRSEQR